MNKRQMILELVLLGNDCIEAGHDIAVDVAFTGITVWHHAKAGGVIRSFHHLDKVHSDKYEDAEAYLLNLLKPAFDMVELVEDAA